MTNRTVFVIFRWDDEEPEMISAWTKEEKAEEELLKLQDETPESTLFILPKNLTSVNDR